MKNITSLIFRVLLLNNLQRAIAIALGVLAGGLTMAVVEVWAMHAIFNMPDTMMENTAENVSEYLTQIPVGAQWTIAGSHLLGALVAYLLAYLLSERNKMVAWISGGVIAAMTVTHVYGVIHPTWMSWGMPLAAGLGLWIGSVIIQAWRRKRRISLNKIERSGSTP